MKISIITVVLNAKETIADTLASIARQRYSNIEHIVIDGGSTDGTKEILDAFQNQIAILVSEPDNGLYDAMNKGLDIASGDVIGFLNADDIFTDDSVLDQIAEAHKEADLDACYADLHYVQQSDLASVVRNWVSRPHYKGLCFKGWMPAHPTLYMKRRVYESVGRFNTNLRYQSDLEFCARVFELEGIDSKYVSRVWVKMRLGGVTNNSLKSILAGNWESYLALRKLGMKRDPMSYFAIKFFSRIIQFF